MKQKFVDFLKDLDEIEQKHEVSIGAGHGSTLWLEESGDGGEAVEVEEVANFIAKQNKTES